jgi:DNA integrity scanning protein DisA with diadenylate cyclase activity
MSGGENGESTHMNPAAPKEHVQKIENLEGISAELTAKLAGANLTEVEQLKGLSAKDLASIEGISDAEAHEVAEAVKKVK